MKRDDCKADAKRFVTVFGGTESKDELVPLESSLGLALNEISLASSRYEHSSCLPLLQLRGDHGAYFVPMPEVKACLVLSWLIHAGCSSGGPYRGFSEALGGGTSRAMGIRAALEVAPPERWASEQPMWPSISSWLGMA